MTVASDSWPRQRQAERGAEAQADPDQKRLEQKACSQPGTVDPARADSGWCVVDIRYFTWVVGILE